MGGWEPTHMLEENWLPISRTGSTTTTRVCMFCTHFFLFKTPPHKYHCIFRYDNITYTMLAHLNKWLWDMFNVGFGLFVDIKVIIFSCPKVVNIRVIFANWIYGKKYIYFSGLANDACFHRININTIYTERDVLILSICDKHSKEFPFERLTSKLEPGQIRLCFDLILTLRLPKL